MKNRRAELPSYEETCANSQHSICQGLFDFFLKEPILIAITLTAIIGCICLLSGLVLLAMISRSINDQTSEAILLMGMGFFVLSVASVTWKLTYRSRLGAIIGVIKEEERV